MTMVDFTCVANVVLYSFSEAAGTYDEYGPVSCALIGSKDADTTYKLGCYREEKYICTADVLPSNDAGAQVARDGVYITFRDDKSHFWSIQHGSEDAAIEFCAQITVAMYGAAGEPKESILALDVAKGKENKQVFAGDLVKAYYRSWVVQCSNTAGALPRLGSLLEKESEDAAKYVVPANHQGVVASMRGFEGMTVGMREAGQRFTVVPVKVKRGRGPSVNMCFYVEVLRRKDQQTSSKTHQHRGTKERNLLADVQEKDIDAGIRPQALAIRALPYEERVSSAATGFSKDQFLLVDRLRDQVFALTEQLRDTRRELDSVCADLKRHERQAGARSLTGAQIEYSIEQLLASNDSKMAAVEEKRSVVGDIEARNRELETKLARFLQTNKVLAEEVKDTLNDNAGERVELDRHISDTQAHVARLSREVDDAGRHLQALKNVLRANEVRLKEEKNRLNVSMSDYEVNKEKLHSLQESFSDETSRRRLLEGKLLSAQEELRRLQEDAQLKESLAQQINAKMESDAAHYNQLVQQEREQATIELRQLKQDLIEDLAARNRQQEAVKERVAEEAYEQGMAQGVEEGLSDAVNESDAIAHDMAVNAQRCKAEEAALLVRLEANRAANEADERHLVSRLDSLEGALTQALQDNNTLSTQLEAVQAEHAARVGNLYQKLTRLISSCSNTPISQLCLMAMMQAAETGTEFDPFSFQRVEASKEAHQAREERRAVSTWVRASVYNQPAHIPPLRPPFPCASSSKGPFLSSEVKGTKALLSPTTLWNPPMMTTAEASVPAALVREKSPPAVSSPSKIPPQVSAAVPTASARTQLAQTEPEGGGTVPTAATRSRVNFPSVKIRYLDSSGGRD